jgi:hypothetical protein
MTPITKRDATVGVKIAVTLTYLTHPLRPSTRTAAVRPKAIETGVATTVTRRVLPKLSKKKSVLEQADVIFEPYEMQVSSWGPVEETHEYGPEHRQNDRY